MNSLVAPSPPVSLSFALRNEARAVLRRYTPASLGQALRISGITPADVTVLSVRLARR